MAKQIYVNLAVKDLQKAMGFFQALGFLFEPSFTNDKAACLVIGENIYAMLLVESFFKSFISKELCEAKKSTEVLVCLSCESRQEVDELVAKAVKAGGHAPRKAQDMGFMYSHGFEDLDGHLWELVHMKPGAKPPSHGRAGKA